MKSIRSGTCIILAFILSIATGCTSNEQQLVDAAYDGKAAAVEELLRAGVSPDAHDRSGMTALMAAARFNRPELIKRLIDAGASVDKKDNYGWTALMVAANQGSTEAVKMLVENGAQVTIRAKDGRSAVDLSAAREDAETLSYFYDVIGTLPNASAPDIKTHVTSNPRY